MAKPDKKSDGKKRRKPMSDEARQNIRAGKIGKKRKPFTPEHRARMRMALLAVWRDPNKRAAITAGRWGGKDNE